MYGPVVKGSMVPVALYGKYVNVVKRDRQANR